jgi:hypothetical protein
MTVEILPAAGGYAAAPGWLQYSRGVRALADHAIVRVRFQTPIPLDAGFARIATWLRDMGRPLTSLCACELRSPSQFTEDGFRAFNQRYAQTLRAWGVMQGDANPVARSNVIPPIAPPQEPSFYAFCYAVPQPGATPTFVAAGAGETTEGIGSYPERIIAYGDTSAAGMRRKAERVIDEMEHRMALVSGSWKAATDVQVYAVHEIHSFVPDLLLARGAAAHGLTWHFARPPVVGLEYEMDVRAVIQERVTA